MNIKLPKGYNLFTIKLQPKRMCGTNTKRGASFKYRNIKTTAVYDTPSQLPFLMFLDFLPSAVFGSFNLFY